MFTNQASSRLLHCFSFPMLLMLGCGAASRSSTTTQSPLQTDQELSSTTSPPEREMMVIRVVLAVQPNQDEAFRNYLKEESQKVRKLPGCLRYELYRSAESDTYLLYEEWETEAAFDAYKKTEIFKESFAVLGPMLAGKPDSAYFRTTQPDTP